MLPIPLTFALIRLLCFDASNSYTLSARTPLALAIDNILFLISESSMGLYSFKRGEIKTGWISSINIKNTEVTQEHQIHNLFLTLRTMAYKTVIKIPPRIRITPRGLSSILLHSMHLIFPSAQEIGYLNIFESRSQD